MNFREERFCRAPLRHCFRVFTEFDRYADRLQGIRRVTVLTDGPTCEDTLYEEVRVLADGKTERYYYTVTAFEANKQIALRCTSRMLRFTYRYDFFSNGDITTLQATMGVQPERSFMWLAMPVLWLLAGTYLAEELKLVVDQLTEAAEDSVVSSDMRSSQ